MFLYPKKAMVMHVGIIGGGAAGMMAAAYLCEHAPKGTKITLFERNSLLGAKVIISGGGRCNVTTGFEDLGVVLRRYPRGARFIRTAMYDFPPKAVRQWFESHGVPLKCEKDLRVFPKSDNGKDVVGAFERLFARSRGMEVRLKAHVTHIEHDQGTFVVRLKDGSETRVGRLIITTGGQAYRHTGSSGDGYTFAEQLGHRITPLAASLSAFTLQEEWPKKLSGVSFQKARVFVKKPKPFTYDAPVLLTHKGTTGPAIFALSAHIAFETCTADNPGAIELDVLPGYSQDELTQHFLKAKNSDAKKALLTLVAQLTPRSFAQEFLSAHNFTADRIMAETSDSDLRRLAQLLKHIPLHVIGRTAGDEFVTAGGVVTKEVNPKTMESRLTPGLYFAGEILDVDGYTGGFNLQASWAGGHLAGKSASIHIENTLFQ